MEVKKPQRNNGKKKVEYKCIKCNYITRNKKDYNRHLKTKKHLRKRDKSIGKQKNVEFICNKCNKIYKTHGGLWKHTQKCLIVINKNVENMEVLEVIDGSQKTPKLNEDSAMSNAILKLVESNQKLVEQNAEMMKCMKEQSKLTQELIPKVGNTTNNISINFFLNEQCKNAMNLTDFINQLQVSLEDLQYSKNNGFIEGVTNIFTKQLQDLKPTERPIHCSDKKRLQFYVKDNDTWQKDENNKKIDETIYNIKMAQTKKLTEWEKLHPNYMQDPKLSQEWGDILNSCTEGLDNPVKTKEKLKRNIASKIQIKEALRDVNEK
jgi:uncharacterized C2H2 Zn-finger protein